MRPELQSPPAVRAVEEPGAFAAYRAPARDDARGAQPRSEFTWSTFSEAVRRQRRLAAGVVLATMAVGSAAILLVPRRYASSATFIVEAPAPGALSSAVAGLLGQLNPAMTPGASPRFYADLVTSRPLMDALLALRPVETCGRGPRRTLLERLDAGGRTPAESLFFARKALADRLDGDFDLRTGVVSASVEAECPALARELLDSVLAQLNAFNVEKRQTRAKLRRVFAEQQVGDAEADLRRAEADLAAFLSGNRAIESPSLKIESDRLQRRVTMREELAATLRHDFEAARLDEINSTPALTVIEPPDLPAKPSFPRRRLLFALLALASCALAAGAVLLRVALEPPPSDASPAFARLHAALGRLRGGRATLAG